MKKTPVFFLWPTLILAIAAMNTVAQAQLFSTLYNFGANPTAPSTPSRPGIIAQGRDGNMYGTAGGGDSQNDGVVFRITPGGELTVLYRFDGTHGSGPLGGLTLATDGNFYGTTIDGGTFGHGTVFKITPAGKLTVLYNFTGGSDEGAPIASPIQAADGNFYGTTEGGGNLYGTVYKMTPAGVLTTLHKFEFNVAYDCSSPLVQAGDGNFYGTTQAGSFGGTIFKITPQGQFTLIYTLTVNDGLSPIAPLVQGTDGDLYGTAAGGEGSLGTVFRVPANGFLEVIHSFTGTDGDDPYGGLALASDRKYYGTTLAGGTLDEGVVFGISSGGADFSVLHDFDGTNGSNPSVTLLQHTNGIFYGDTTFGGAYGLGTFYSLNDGIKPFISLVSASGKVGMSIDILGQGFTGTTSVSFNGTAATYTIKSDTYLNAMVPNGATSGFVTVTTPGGLLTSNRKFRVTP